MDEQFKTPELSTTVDDVDKAEAMAYAGKEDIERAAGERALAEKFGDQDEGKYELRKLASAEWHDAEASRKENQSAYEYELENADETYLSYIKSLPKILQTLGIDPGLPTWNKLFNEINQNIIDGKYSKKTVEDLKNETGNLPYFLESGVRLDISISDREK